jgi:hypothetical protein
LEPKNKNFLKELLKEEKKDEFKKYFIEGCEQFSPET